MHTSFLKLAVTLLLGSQAVLALPAGGPGNDGNGNGNGNGIGNGRGRGNGRGNGNNAQLASILQGTGIRGMSVQQLNKLLENLAGAGVALGCDAGAGAGAGDNVGRGDEANVGDGAQEGGEVVEGGEGAGAGEGGGEAGAGAGEGEGEAGEENEVVLQGEFGTPVAVEGGDIKQDILYTATAVGAFEYEYQAAAADEITVTENKTPAAAPAGFEAIEPSSFIVTLAQSKGVGLTLSKIDYIFDAASAGLAGKDVTGAKVGKLCAETGEFVISETLGELEFELEENEVTLNLNKNVTAEGEWGIFLPVAAAAAA